MSGMRCNRRCACGATLDVNDGERCADCRPRLSAIARAAGRATRIRAEKLAELKRDTTGLTTAIKRVERKMRWRTQRG